jgi:hypothetical protein
MRTTNCQRERKSERDSLEQAGRGREGGFGEEVLLDGLSAMTVGSCSGTAKHSCDFCESVRSGSRSRVASHTLTHSLSLYTVGSQRDTMQQQAVIEQQALPIVTSTTSTTTTTTTTKQQQQEQQPKERERDPKGKTGSGKGAKAQRKGKKGVLLASNPNAQIYKLCSLLTSAILMPLNFTNSPVRRRAALHLSLKHLSFL